MQIVKYITFFLILNTWSQSSITPNFINKFELKAEQLVHVDNYNAVYKITNNELSIKKNGDAISYSNLSLGNISSVNAFNPLKNNIFYKDFNTVIILDNRLAEITKVDFNSTVPFRNVSKVSTGNDNTIWLFNENTRQLELFDYLTHKTRATTLPIDGEVLSIESNYNYCWLLTDTHIYTYNYFGSLLSKIANNGYTSIKNSGKTLFLLKENQLYINSQDSNKTEAIKLPQLLIKQFLVTNETLYIYDGKFLYRYQLITN